MGALGPATATSPSTCSTSRMSAASSAVFPTPRTSSMPPRSPVPDRILPLRQRRHVGGHRASLTQSGLQRLQRRLFPLAQRLAEIRGLGRHVRCHREPPARLPRRHPQRGDVPSACCAASAAKSRALTRTPRGLPSPFGHTLLLALADSVTHRLGDSVTHRLGGGVVARTHRPVWRPAVDAVSCKVLALVQGPWPPGELEERHTVLANKAGFAASQATMGAG